MPDTYISRAGMDNKDMDVKFTNSELGGLKNDLVGLQQQNQIKDERIAVLQSTIDDMQQHLAMITEVLVQKPTVEGVEGPLAAKRRIVRRAP